VLLFGKVAEEVNALAVLPTSEAKAESFWREPLNDAQHAQIAFCGANREVQFIAAFDGLRNSFSGYPGPSAAPPMRPSP
jgi:hypothetical protein